MHRAPRSARKSLTINDLRHILVCSGFLATPPPLRAAALYLVFVYFVFASLLFAIFLFDIHKNLYDYLTMNHYSQSEVYFNLRKNLFSVRQNGLVVAHERCVVLEDVVFKVSQAGRARVLREKRKNVHAFVKGVLSKQYVDKYDGLARYNPYETETFLDKSGNPLHGAKFVCLIVDHKGKAKIFYKKH